MAKLIIKKAQKPQIADQTYSSKLLDLLAQMCTEKIIRHPDTELVYSEEIKQGRSGFWLGRVALTVSKKNSGYKVVITVTELLKDEKVTVTVECHIDSVGLPSLSLETYLDSPEIRAEVLLKLFNLMVTEYERRDSTSFAELMRFCKRQVKQILDL